MAKARPLTGASAIALAIVFNVPFSVLAATYNYPDVLRGPPGEALDLFAAGGAQLIMTWHAFALSALALIPVSIALSLTPQRVAERPALAIGAAITGALAGLAQAIGLWRWVFVIPGPARQHAAGDAETQRAAERAFDILNQYGGVAIGEHLGQWLTALFILMLALAQWGERARISATIGFIATALIAAGTHEGIAIALGQPSEIFGLITIAGFMAFTLWLIATGIGLFRAPRA
ncbi:DUF4386 family protein [Terricaulis silvestris]|uniref:DUF4386 domain-containing protein n=1 Tax=Terricaulis silvestris TaxID=2686094 RepID=A0A6I6MLC0_9CAUL|nr:DUF4386 family protein [Terricaulis silvestris]QGZ93976.1 hypothetical protein DSM104635_00791 [Terricaulis silvestris]